MNWNPRPSVYDQMQLDRAKRRDHIEGFVAQQQSLAGAFASVRQYESDGMAEIISNVALDRINKKA